MQIAYVVSHEFLEGLSKWKKEVDYLQANICKKVDVKWWQLFKEEFVLDESIHDRVEKLHGAFPFDWDMGFGWCVSLTDSSRSFYDLNEVEEGLRLKLSEGEYNFAKYLEGYRYD